MQRKRDPKGRGPENTSSTSTNGNQPPAMKPDRTTSRPPSPRSPHPSPSSRGNPSPDRKSPSLARILSFFILAAAALALIAGIVRTSSTGQPHALGAGAIAFLFLGWLASHLSRG